MPYRLQAPGCTLNSVKKSPLSGELPPETGVESYEFEKKLLKVLLRPTNGPEAMNRILA